MTSPKIEVTIKALPGMNSRGLVDHIKKYYETQEYTQGVSMPWTVRVEYPTDTLESEGPKDADVVIWLLIR